MNVIDPTAVAPSLARVTIFLPSAFRTAVADEIT
jgi:hypothetical protein